MFFSRLRLAGSDGAMALGRAAYDLHRSVWRLFDDAPARRRDFLYRLEDAPGEVLLHAVSARPPRDEAGLWQVETKVYDPQLAAGEALAFCLRANAVRSARVDGRVKRHDVVLDLKKRLTAEGVAPQDLPGRPELWRRAGLAWLSERAENLGFAFEPEALSVDAHRVLSFAKASGGRPVRLSTLDFAGPVRVTDPERLRRALFSGVGPAKGFGCGLLLVRRR
jgi:CRISPR system Cascade subunit CasE